MTLSNVFNYIYFFFYYSLMFYWTISIYNDDCRYTNANVDNATKVRQGKAFYWMVMHILWNTEAFLK